MDASTLDRKNKGRLFGVLLSTWMSNRIWWSLSYLRCMSTVDTQSPNAVMKWKRKGMRWQQRQQGKGSGGVCSTLPWDTWLNPPLPCLPTPSHSTPERQRSQRLSWFPYPLLSTPSHSGSHVPSLSSFPRPWLGFPATPTHIPLRNHSHG